MNVARIDAQTGAVLNVEVWASAPTDTAEHLFREAGDAGIGWTWDGEGFEAPPAPPFSLPPQIAMHKARKALKQLGPSGTTTPETYADSWWMRTLAVIDGLTNPIQRDCIMDELNTAPNMVLGGATTQMVRTAVGMSDEQLEAVALLALTLP